MSRSTRYGELKKVDQRAKNKEAVFEDDRDDLDIVMLALGTLMKVSTPFYIIYTTNIRCCYSPRRQCGT